MQVEVLVNNANIDFDCSGCIAFHSKSLLAREKYVFELELWLDSEQAGLELIEVALWLRHPALDLHLMLTWLEGNHTHAIACD